MEGVFALVLCAWEGVTCRLRGATAAQPHATDQVAQTSEDKDSDVRASSPAMYKLSEFSLVCFGRKLFLRVGL